LHAGNRVKLSNRTFLETFNCDGSGTPKPSWSERAKKQLYRADYVPYHYVHYSTVTQGFLTTYKDDPAHWKRTYAEYAPSERVTDEVHEATMIHAKAGDTSRNYKISCRFDYEKKWKGCMVGYPWPSDNNINKATYDENGMDYNCFVNTKVEQYWLPRLEKALAVRKVLWRSTA
jgi:hypothetical protein